MHHRGLFIRAAAVVAGLAAVALAAAPSALAAVPGENIFGSGASPQKGTQQKVWIPKWEAPSPTNPAVFPNQTGLSCSPEPCAATYTSTSTGGGLAEFGNTTGGLDLTQDTAADNGGTNGYGTPVLDAYVGSEDPPTGPLSTAGTNLADASQAATGSAATPIDEITVPSQQSPLPQLFSLPVGLTIGCTVNSIGVCVHGGLKLKNLLWQEIWSDTVPASTHYSANTWGAVLELAGLKRVASSPKATQFTDDGTGGGSQAIQLNVRSNSAGTSYTLKGALNLSGAPAYTSSFVSDDPTWPVATTPAGTSNSALAGTTENTPGSVGYSDLATAAGLGGGGLFPFTAQAQNVSNGGTHQILYASIQDNWCGTGSPTCGDTTSTGAPRYVFASPQAATVGVANVYTGNNININGSGGVGNWNVPFTGGTFDPTGSWGGTLASDPDVYDHSLNISTGAKLAGYPIVGVTFNLGWSDYDEVGSNLVGDYGGSAAQATAAGDAAISFLKYVVAPAKGQKDLTAARPYTAKLPGIIDGYAVKAANALTP